MRRNNPFASKPDNDGGLLDDQAGMRSDQYEDSEARGSGNAAQPPPSSLGAPRAAAEAPVAAAAGSEAVPPLPPAGAEAAPGVPVSGFPGYGGAAAPMASAPPGAVTDSYSAYPPPSSGAGGAWGQQQPVMAAGYPPPSGFSSGPAGYPPSSGPAGYPPGPPSYQAAGVPVQGYATAWTGGYATDQPLSYTSFQTSGAPEQRPPLKCGGCGEQWVLFLCGILIWPLWYVALIWGCVKPEQRNDPRQRTPFILNCIASFVFTLVWVAIVVRETNGWSDWGYGW